MLEIRTHTYVTMTFALFFAQLPYAWLKRAKIHCRISGLAVTFSVIHLHIQSASQLGATRSMTEAMYPACVAVGIAEGDCCPNGDHVTLGCCNGFPTVAEDWHPLRHVSLKA